MLLNSYDNYIIMKEKSMNKKIFFTDLDGTLLNDEKEITPKTREVLAKITQMGHYLVFISGRPLMSIMEARKSLPVSDKNLYLVASNGGVIYDAEKDEILRENRLTLEQTDYIMKYCEQAGVHSHTYTEDAIVSKRQSEELTFYQKTIHMPSLITDDIIGNLDKPPLKCVALSMEKKNLDAIKEGLGDWAEGQVQLMFSHDKLLEMIPITSGKGTAVKWLSEYLGVELCNTLAAGDMDNDISMLEAAGVGVAMANGAPHVKKIADKITEMDNNNDGLVPVLEEFFVC